MATATKKGQEEKITALYARLSDDDPEEEKKKGKGGEADKESNSIQNQDLICQGVFLPITPFWIEQ